MHVVIVGAGQAGAWVARSLRENGFEGEVTLLGTRGLCTLRTPPFVEGRAQRH
jgi:3-phenylpropionate/trans-cinnamate dioxygenase ferredoxin reductase subunit